MKQISRMFAPASVVLVAMLSIAGCKGDGSVSTNGIFGEMPAVAEDFGNQGVALLESAKTLNTLDEIKEFAHKAKALDSTANAAIDAALRKLEGLELPTVIDETCPVKITKPFMIDMEQSKEQKVVFVGEVENTEDINKSEKSKNPLYLEAALLDKDDNAICTSYRTKYDTSASNDEKYNKGVKGNITITVEIDIWNAKLMAQVKKAKLTYVHSDAYKALTDTCRKMKKQFYTDMQAKEREAKEALLNKMK